MGRPQGADEGEFNPAVQSASKNQSEPKLEIVN